MGHFHIGTLKQGRRLIVEVADDIDALDCETWEYYGIRDITIAELKRRRPRILEAVNEEHGTQFTAVLIRRK